MTIVSFDSSAFVKLVVEEASSDLAAALWDGCDAAISSRLAYPEVRAALAAAGRDHRLDADAQRQAEAAWDEYWVATRAVELTEKIVVHAGAMAGEHAFRGADAVHPSGQRARRRHRRAPVRRVGSAAARRGRGGRHPART